MKPTSDAMRSETTGYSFLWRALIVRQLSQRKAHCTNEKTVNEFKNN